MEKKVLIVSASLRSGSNSEIMARTAMRGAEEAGHAVTWLSLKGQQVSFCTGCLTCRSTGKCILWDDMDACLEAVRQADVIVFATPIYDYSLCGQLKTFLDRCNPLYIADYRFREIYLLTASAEDGDAVAQTAKACIQGWTDCFPKAAFSGMISGGGAGNPKEITFRKRILEQCFELGKNI